MSKVEDIIQRSPVALLMKRHKKHADMQLYLVLRDCMEIAEVCLRDPKEYAVLDKLITKLPLLSGKTRQYVERSSDIYQRVCRFMFHGEEHTANTNRYAHALREAASQSVTSKKIVDELADGGINKFFLKRPSQGQVRLISTKCLRLDRAVRHFKNDEIVLRLKRTVENVYEVLEFNDGTAMQPRLGAPARSNGAKDGRRASGAKAGRATAGAR